MRIFRKILLVLLFALIVIQFFRPDKNVSANQHPNAIEKHYTVPDNVNTILVKACNDCHSNNTKYPWYFNVQPVAWWLNDHVVDGKHDLNFDEFATYSLRKQYKRMDDVIELVKENEMPLESYTWLHNDAKLTATEKEAIVQWANTIRDTMQARYPIDSIVKKK